MAHQTEAHRSPPRQHVVIIGGGFGGLEAARALAKAPVDLTLIDRRNHHLFQPLLYQVATAALSPAEIAWPIRHLLHRQSNVRVLMGEAYAIDPARRCVATSQGEVAYDQLVVATGATHSYFGHPEWAVCAPGLKSLEDATAIRRRVLIAFEKAEAGGQGLDGLLTFVIVGGGPTGVEMAGAVAELARDALRHDFRDIDPKRARIILIEAGPRILPALPVDLAAYAQARLGAIGVEVMTATRVTGCDLTGVDVEGGRIAAATLVWAAGVAASPLAASLPAPHDAAGRTLVAPDLSLPEHPDVFVIGDAAGLRQPNGAPVPGIAPAAKQAGQYVGAVIAARVSGRPAPAPFRYLHAGDLATIGRSAAIVKLGPVRLKGFPAWLFWGVAHVYFLIGVRNRIAVALDWAWNWLTRQRSVRLIINDG